jgi:adenylate kinase family enzyme
MRIALLGAPSSGKSLVARRLAARLNRQAIKSESVERWKVT